MDWGSALEDFEEVEGKDKRLKIQNFLILAICLGNLMQTIRCQDISTLKQAIVLPYL